MNRGLLQNLLIALFVLLFVYAGTVKLMNFPQNAHSMHNQPLAAWLAGFLTYAVPIAELMVAALLLFERTKLPALYLFTGIMMVFTAYVALILGNYYGRIPCSCGGLMKSLTWTTHLYFNIAFTCMGMLAIYLEHKKSEPRSGIRISIKPAVT